MKNERIIKVLIGLVIVLSVILSLVIGLCLYLVNSDSNVTPLEDTYESEINFSEPEVKNTTQGAEPEETIAPQTGLVPENTGNIVEENSTPTNPTEDSIPQTGTPSENKKDPAKHENNQTVQTEPVNSQPEIIEPTEDQNISPDYEYELPETTEAVEDWPDDEWELPE